MRVQGKMAFITGAASGLGKASAMMLAREGAKVSLSDINEDGVKAAADEINQKYPGQAFAYRLDVTHEENWKAALEAAHADMGGLNVLLNNAGIGGGTTVEDTDYDTWKRVHAVDVDSVFLGCKYAVSLMKKSKNGSIINVSSIAGIIAGHNMAAYNSAKAAVRHLSKSIALHCAKERNGIRCNSVHPAFIDTPILNEFTKKIGREIAIKKLSEQIPIGQIGDPIDVAYGILYLASNESKFVTGSELIIDGGISA